MAEPRGKETIDDVSRHIAQVALWALGIAKAADVHFYHGTLPRGFDEHANLERIVAVQRPP